MSARRALLALASLALLLGATASSGCAPLTFSNEASIDFQQYPSVIVEVAGPDGSRRQADYLESELRQHSGFGRVLGATSVTRQAASARLLVELTLDFSYDIELFDEDGDDEADVDTSYSASVRYRLFAADGVLLDSGVDSVDGEETSFDAAEEALDLVVLRYLRPYRL